VDKRWDTIRHGQVVQIGTGIEVGEVDTVEPIGVQILVVPQNPMDGIMKEIVADGQTEAEPAKYTMTPHRFTRLDTDASVSMYYTCVRDIEDTDVPRFKQHLDVALYKPWIWIIDCDKIPGDTRIDMPFITGISTIVDTDHHHSLRKVWIVNPSFEMRILVGLSKPWLPTSVYSKLTCG
jgi:hypothetical protein